MKLMEVTFVELSEEQLSNELWKETGEGVAELMVHAGLTKSNSEGRRLIQGGAVKINDRAVRHPFARLAIVDDRYWLMERPANER